jgi:pyruvate/2-oxoglutarate dehydrogenase complex dihydrolipoamide acyltransferase (E2) component
MAFEFHLPDLAEGMTEAEVVGWKVKEGDQVAIDQPIVEVMSDKATVEIPSPRAGVLSRINYKEGQVCKVGEVLFVIDEVGAVAAAPQPTAARPPR